MLMRALSTNLRMRPRVQRASGIPCALWIGEGDEINANLGRSAPREREGVFSVILRCAPLRASKDESATDGPSSFEARRRGSHLRVNAIAFIPGMTDLRFGCLTTKSEGIPAHFAAPATRKFVT